MALQQRGNDGDLLALRLPTLLPSIFCCRSDTLDALAPDAPAPDALDDLDAQAPCALALRALALGAFVLQAFVEPEIFGGVLVPEVRLLSEFSFTIKTQFPFARWLGKGRQILGRGVEAVDDIPEHFGFTQQCSPTPRPGLGK